MARAKVENGAVFERYENKYLLNRAQHQALTERLRQHMGRDQYGLHTICSIYYDTDDFAIIRRCLEKPKFKEKLRLRSYGVPRPESIVYLELKKKLDGITYKRRVPLHLFEARDYFQSGYAPGEQRQILGEIDWYVRQHPLEAKVLICYDRIALYGLEYPNFRITMDANVRWRDTNLMPDKGDYGRALLPSKTYLMEVKTLGALPLWFVQILSEQKIYPTSFSKYATIYQNHLGAKEEIRYAV